jgi:hypothetical protein
MLLSKTPSCFYLKHNVLYTGFCLHLRVEPTHFGPIDRASPYLRRQNPVSETFCVLNKTGTMDNVHTILLLIFYRVGPLLGSDHETNRSPRQRVHTQQ